MYGLKLMIKFHFEIRPKAKASVRVSGRHSYIDKPTKNYMNAVAAMAKEQYCGKPLINPLKVKISFHFKYSKAKTEEPMPRKPDMDNLFKALFDSLTGIAWIDDSQIFEISARKLQNPTKNYISMEIEEIDATKPDEPIGLDTLLF